MRMTSYDQLLQLARNGQPVPMSVAAAHDEETLLAVQQAVELGLIEPLLTGRRPELERIAEAIGFDLTPYPVIHAETEEEAAYAAAKLADVGRAQIVMKGLLNSTPFLKGILHHDFHLRTERLLSHLSVFEIPEVDRLLYLTDGGLNIAPNLQQKEQILQNAIDFLHLLGMNRPKIALLSANERVNEKMPVTVECSKLAQLAKQNRFGTAIVEGPLPLDLAISRESVEHKGIKSEINGDADLLFVPTLETGNIVAKAITYFAHGVMAGVVLGAKVPLILTSRSAHVRDKLASIALSVVAANSLREATADAPVKRAGGSV